MRLAEALRLRKDSENNLGNMTNRIEQNCLVQEGGKPAEDPNELVEVYLKRSRDLKDLITRINLTNSSVKFVFGTQLEPRTLCEALAERDELSRAVDVHLDVAREGVIRGKHYSSLEIRSESVVNVSKYQKIADKLSAELRQLDSKIQEQNWTVELI